MRKWIWRLHSWAGLVAALGLVVVGLTGSLLVFNVEIDALLGQSEPAISAGTGRAPLDAVVAAALARHPDLEIFSWYSNDTPGRAERISGTLASTGEGIDLKFDPHTGELLESGPREGAFTGWLLGLHDSLFLGTPGVALVGVLAAALLFSGLTGVYLYRGFWRSLFTLRWRASARIFFSDLHKMVGISSVAFNLVLGFSGALWNLPAVGELFHHAVAPAAPAARPAARPPPPMPLEAMIAAARERLPGLRVRALRYPSDGVGYNVRGGVPTRNPFATGWGDEVHFDPATGAITEVVDLHRAGAWAQLEDMLHPLHFGTFGGLPIKILWCLGGLTPGTLAVSGLLIWRQRRRPAPRPS